jgi:hypothetical protein
MGVDSHRLKRTSIEALDKLQDRRRGKHDSQMTRAGQKKTGA